MFLRAVLCGEAFYGLGVQDVTEFDSDCLQLDGRRRGEGKDKNRRNAWGERFSWGLTCLAWCHGLQLFFCT
jgi:hypothetical protein